MNMKRLLIILFIVSFFTGHAQVIEYPVFDRTDEPKFHVDKIVINSDTTYIHCTYHANYDTWANISSQTYLESLPDGKRFPIIKSEGLPFAPNKRDVKTDEKYHVVLKFSSIRSVNRLNLIEDPNDEAFNIYGIDLNNSFPCSFSESDVESFYRSAMECEEKKNWREAIAFLKKQLLASEFLYGKRSVECSWPMYSLTMQYSGTKEYEKIIEWGKKSIDILRDSPPDSINLDVLARAYGNVGTAYYMMHQHETATQYMELSLATRRLKDGIGVLSYDEYLKEMAKRYYYEENYPKALLYGKEVANIYEIKYKENSKYGCVYINSLNNLCEFYQKMNQYEEASKVGRGAVSLINDGICDDVLWLKYAVYNNLASALSNIGQTDEAICYLEKSLNEAEVIQIDNDRVITNTKMSLANIFLKCKQDTAKAITIYESVLKTVEDSIAVGKRKYPDYAAILHLLYNVYSKKDKRIGIEYLRKAIQIQKEWTGEESIAYANLLIEYINETFIRAIMDNEGVDTLLYNLEKSSSIIKRHINNSIYNMSKSERETYWRRYKIFFTWEIPMICGRLNTVDANSLAYNTSLFYKGMLLSSEKEFKDAIAKSNDSTLVLLYNDYVRNLSLLEKEYVHISASSIVDSLKTIIQNEEYLLSQKVTRFNKECKGTNFSWEEVKQKLGDGDVAIEIVSYPVHDESNICYDAYIVTSKSEAPTLACLFNEKWLEEYSEKDSIENALSSWIWGNDIVYEAIKDAKNIYFSPSGLLNSIGIEYLPISGGRYMNERFNMVRLSSTRELCLLGEKKPIKDVCLYGGLDYNEQKEENVFNKKDTIRLTRSVVDSIEKRGGFEPLTGSKEEVEQIYKEIIGKGIKCRAYTGSVGTESNLKQLSGNDIDIIHLSTHGMYVPIEEADTNKTNYSFVISDNAINIDEEDQSLTHSFIVMSGGNLLIKDKNKQSEKDDGILTALEVSRLDFSNLDLVVLSACQTALGKVESEGVYGLQRGFKKAGANTILMSLDKVDDEATKMLMVEFYKNLMSGKTKHQSFKDAQKYLRQVDNGKYDTPEYWASFIMLDGIN